MKPPKNHLQTGAFPGAPRPARLLRALVGVSGMAAFLAADIGQAQTTIYSNDFSSAPVVNDTINNGNTNYAGTGVPAELNQNEWMVRAGSDTVTHDAADGNVDIVLGNNVYYLVDLTDLENDPGTETTFALSFDVESFSGNVSVFAFAGGGLD